MHAYVVQASVIQRDIRAGVQRITHPAKVIPGLRNGDSAFSIQNRSWSTRETRYSRWYSCSALIWSSAKAMASSRTWCKRAISFSMPARLQSGSWPSYSWRPWNTAHCGWASMCASICRVTNCSQVSACDFYRGFAWGSGSSALLQAVRQAG